MKKITAGLFISLDGVAQYPEKWHEPNFQDEELGQWVGGKMMNADTMLFGRVTHDEFASFWPTQGEENPFAAVMNGTPKFVVSTTITESPWQNTTVLNGKNLVEEINKIKDGDGKDINITGSPTLTRSLIEAGLLDELSLVIDPVIVGRGARLFDGITEKERFLTLTESKALSSGAIVATYVPKN